MLSPQTILNKHLETTDFTFGIFPEYRKEVDETVIKMFLSLSESIVRFTKCTPLTQEIVQLLREKLGKKLTGTLYPGGKDTLFAWNFKCGEKKLVIKPYYNKDLASLILHHLTIDEFGNILTTTLNQTPQDYVIVEIPPVIGFAKIETASYSIPVLISRESIGEPITNFSQIVGMLGDVCKSLALRGFIINLYPANWRFDPAESVIVLEYCDLINSNKIKNVEERITALIQSLNHHITLSHQP